jgi:small subunit ribosomal protein S16
MAVKIRLKRIGKKKTPFYRIIVSDAKAPVQGKFVDEIGTYDPNTNPGTVKVDAERAQKWLSNGAQPTDTVAKIFKMAGVHKN